MPTPCQQLKKDYRQIEALSKAFGLEFQKAAQTGQSERAKELRAEIEQRRDALWEKIDPYHINIRKEIAEKHKFEYVGNFSKDEGLARVSKGVKQFRIDRKGRIIFS